MKITMNIDCTAEEARDFFGLPDVKPLQERFLSKLEENMDAKMAALDPDKMANTWLPQFVMGSMKGMEQFQKMFFNQGVSTSGGPSDPKEDKDKGP
ncbi:DUF6489 family protein [Varunaivibrio sulfuroxidans]|uniref:Uncharacterized protein n=1 Tax=Varunaivibrio sulfuroxidans TaxID=1773489 RepID=A0A4R3JG63_9PROT|nr:DUF6489 family protein [Varunaivibrio sulfuroxidans]TCS64857.1 hypothetical protein EDD55_101188 [Varunaivibrio sulfuroxidans]WES29844.1 DUF6489 family protein [Varunaivibrio sulfuroxidans]